MPYLTPIAAIFLAHGIATASIVEQKDAVTRIIKVAKPSTSIADVAEPMPIIAIIVIISTMIAITVAAIWVFIIAIAGIAQANIIDATRQASAGNNEQRPRQK
jgi:hypothetical protein